MNVMMKIVWVLCFAALGAILVALTVWVVRMPPFGADGATGDPDGLSKPRRAVLRIGLIPERDIFKQFERYRAFRNYLSKRLGGPVELVIDRTYRHVLEDFRNREIDAAFLGSLVTVLAMDELGVAVVAKPELPDGTSTYHGVIFVREDSDIHRLEDLRNHTIGIVPGTTAGYMFPVCVMSELKLLDGPTPAVMVPMGTHDDVAMKVMDGEVDAGAIKNLRLEALERSHPEWKIRRLAKGRCVPNNALCLRADIAGNLAPKLSPILLNMTRNKEGRDALKALGVARFVQCQAKDYMAIYDMAECVEPAWTRLDTPHPLPRRPADWPKPDPHQQGSCYDINY